MKSRALHALELPRVFEYLAGFTVSDAGRQACVSMRPLDSPESVARQTALFEQGRLWALRSNVRLTPFPAVDDLLQYISGSNSVPDQEDFFILRQILVQGREKVDTFLAESQQGDAGDWPLWTARCRELPMPAKSVSALARCLSEEGDIRDEASPELSLVRGELRRLHQQCVRKVKDYAAEYNILHFLQDTFMTLSSDRYVLPLKANFKGRLQGVIHDFSQTGETCFFEPLFLVEINNRLQNLKREEREEERKILTYLGGLLREELPGVRALYEFLVELDLLFARISLADCYDGRMVEFAEGRGILLREARHPLLALAASEKGRAALKSYVQWRSSFAASSDGQYGASRGVSRSISQGGSHDTAGQGEANRLEYSGAEAENIPSASLRSSVSKTVRVASGSAFSGTGTPEAQTDFSGASAAAQSRAFAGKVVPSTLELLPEQRALVISGGNAGGKTVCLKSLGLIALMSMCALPVPVESGSVLPPWRHIHAFIGDEQSLEDHVSTFTAQIRHLGRIWDELSAESLVILDEFGAGTDPSQGAALAQAVVDSLMECGSYVAAATHFPALKAYALSTEGVRAASVLFDPGSKKPLFRLVYDQVGASQALDVAREHGLPEKVLRRAEQYLLISGEDSSALVDRLNSLAVTRETEIASLKEEKKSYEERRHKLKESMEKERARLFDSLQAESQTILRDWKTSKITHKQALKELARLRSTLVADGAGGENGPAWPELDVATLPVRGRVRHIPWKRMGTVIEVDERKKRVRLDFDGVTLWADAKDIESPEAATGAVGPGGNSRSERGSSSSGGHVGASAPSLPLRLDLRGLRADVAVSDLEKFLDGAILGGRDAVEVIHGRGTGVLRREVHAFLKNFPAVRDFQLANEEQGGDGMTIVSLR